MRLTLKPFVQTCPRGMPKPVARTSKAKAASQDPPDATPAMTPEMQEAMKDPEVQKRMAAMTEAMKTPEAQAKAAEMQSALANPALQSRLQELQEDPEFDELFADLKEGGMGALMKYWNDPKMLAKLGTRLNDIAPPPGADGEAAPPPAKEVSNLFDAARAGDLEAVEDFLAVGQDVNMLDAEKRTPLHYATAHNHAHIVKALLEAKPNLEAVDAKSNTPLHYAAGYGCVDIVEILLDAGADIKALNINGKTPLEIAGLNDKNPVLKLDDMVARLTA